MTAVGMGAVCVLLRWLQNMNAFEPETGLILPGHTLSILLALALMGSAVGLWVQNRSLRTAMASEDPEKAMAETPLPLTAVMISGAIIAIGGTVLYYFTGSNLVEKMTALPGLFSLSALLLFPSLNRWGGFGAFLSLCPVFFFSVWFVVAYRDYARDPVLWNYAPLMLAIAASLYAAYRLAAYFHYRAQPTKTVFGCCLATVLNLTVLMDTAIGAGRLILGGWAVGFAAIAGMLILNMSEILPEYDVDDEYE